MKYKLRQGLQSSQWARGSVLRSPSQNPSRMLPVVASSRLPCDLHRQLCIHIDGLLSAEPLQVIRMPSAGVLLSLNFKYRSHSSHQRPRNIPLRLKRLRRHQPSQLFRNSNRQSGELGDPVACPRLVVFPRWSALVPSPHRQRAFRARSIESASCHQPATKLVTSPR